MKFNTKHIKNVIASLLVLTAFTSCLTPEEEKKLGFTSDSVSPPPASRAPSSEIVQSGLPPVTSGGAVVKSGGVVVKSGDSPSSGKKSKKE
jgi:hypothetical protein